uniref:Uncharacterized protein n=1 Tax=Romanomermis culicivorax TaxID=13658 RepID=A0A915JM45_ROMCU
MKKLRLGGAIQSAKTHVLVPPFQRPNLGAAVHAPASLALAHLGVDDGAGCFGAKLPFVSFNFF